MTRRTPDKSRFIKGRGTAQNPPNRFENMQRLPEDGLWEDTHPKTQYIDDTARTMITYNRSPDIPFEASINVYRGCEHGCIYCYARPTHEYLGYTAGLDFETKILIKRNAPALLKAELAHPRWRPKVLAMSGVTDPYQPVERRLKLTRGCLEVLRDFRNPVALVTKSSGVLRDIDLLSELSAFQAVAVFISITTLDSQLHQKLEPRAARPEKRFTALEALSQAGIPAGVMLAPVIPGLNDQEIPNILKAAQSAGAVCAGMVPLRLPYAVAPLFEDWLTQHVPDQKTKVLHRIRAMRGGKLNDATFNKRMQGEGAYIAQVRALFDLSCRKIGLQQNMPNLSCASFRSSRALQLSLFN